MAAAIATHVFLCAIVLQFKVTQQLAIINPTTMPTDVAETCPSQELLKNVRKNISNDIRAILANFQFNSECGNGLWRRVAFLNMSDPQQQCPSAWRLYSTNGVRACGRPVTSLPTCPAVIYTTGRQYNRVCGRIIGYQVATPGAFHVVYTGRPPSGLDDVYIDGVSVTHGNPRSHIWTFAAGVTEGTYVGGAGPDCPCSRPGATQAPGYIGNNYYCESGNSANSGILGYLYSSDPLWDGLQCEGQCCGNGKSPPWFSIQLPNPTMDDIEVRICGDESTNNEDTPLGLIEIYVS